MLEALGNFILRTNLLFSKATRDVKTADPMLAHKMKFETREIEYLVCATPLKASLPETIQLLYNAVGHNNPEFYEDARKCRVSRVEHRRHQTKPHERIVVHYAFSEEEKTTVRFATIDRYVELDREEDRSPHSSRCASLVYRPNSFLTCLSGLVHVSTSGSPRERLDQLVIYDDLNELNGRYNLVRAFNVPPLALNMFDVVVIAKAVGDHGFHYSALSYMCLWSATVIFRLLHEHVESLDKSKRVEVIQGDAFDIGGQCAGITLVNLESGCLYLSSDHHKLSVDNRIKKLYEQGAKKDELKSIHEEMLKDLELSKVDGLALPRTISRTALEEEHARFLKRTEECRARTVSLAFCVSFRFVIDARVLV